MNKNNMPRSPLGSQSQTFKAQGSQGPKSERPAAARMESGFSMEEANLLHEAISLAGMRWFDGLGVIMAKKEQFELSFRAGESQNARWVVMAFSLYNMNEPSSAEICLHFWRKRMPWFMYLIFSIRWASTWKRKTWSSQCSCPCKGSRVHKWRI